MGALLSRDFLESIGIDLDEQTYDSLSQHYEDTLNERVVSEIVEDLESDQLIELTALKDGENDDLQEWLVANVPHLDEIIEDEIAILMGEIAESSHSI